MDGATVQSRWFDVCRLDEIPLRGARVVRTPGREIGLFRTADGEVLAIDNRCPHKNGPLTEGIVHDGAVTCPLHSWVIDLRTGKARGADEGCVGTFAVEIRAGERVFLKASD